MSSRTVVEVPDGRRSAQAIAGPFEVTRLDFPAGFRHGAFEPERGYIVVVLDGAVCKTFAGDTATLVRDSVSTLPAGSTHSSEFSPAGAQVLCIRAADGDQPLLGSLLAKRRHVRAAASTALGWRMACELEARDPSWNVALEGLVLQLIATATRASSPPAERGAAWVQLVRDLLHERVPGQPSLGELADAVGRHPTHVARTFRAAYGQTVAQYSRGLRLDWAAARLTGGEAPLAQIAVEAGFADQSHFTRAFRRHTGVTPGRFRTGLERV